MCVMDNWDALTDKAILAELGARLKRLRLDRNVTQQALADEAGISRLTLQKLEGGKAVQLVSLIRVMRALGIAGRIDGLLPESTPSPIEMLDRSGKQRKRARS